MSQHARDGRVRARGIGGLRILAEIFGQFFVAQDFESRHGITDSSKLGAS
jgi:hypothetical protein